MNHKDADPEYIIINTSISDELQPNLEITRVVIMNKMQFKEALIMPNQLRPFIAQAYQKYFADTEEIAKDE